MNLTPVIRQRFFDANGNPLAGGKLHTYQAGTTTPQATYTDQEGSTPNENPVVLDANGEADVWLDPSLSYKFVLTDSDDVTQWTVDNVIGLLGEDTVDTISLKDRSVTQVKIAENAVGSFELQSSSTLDSGRAVGTDHIKTKAITKEKMETPTVTTDGTDPGKGGFAVGELIEEFQTEGISFVAVPKPVTLTTTGRPVEVFLQAGWIDQDLVPIFGAWAALGTTQLSADFMLRRVDSEENSYTVGVFELKNTSYEYGTGMELNVPPSSFKFIDWNAPAGTYTYQIWARSGMSGAVYARIDKCYLIAHEL